MRTIALLLSSFVLSAQAIAQTVDQLVQQLADASSFDDAMVGLDGARTETFRTYLRLCATATAAQLQELLRHRSPVVRCYAVRGLLDTEAKVDWPQVALACIDDRAEVTERSGCETSKRPAGDLVFELLRPRKVLPDEALLDVAEQLVLRKSPLFAREWALRSLRFRDGMLHTIRALAEQGDAPALVALARYRLQKDVPLLLARLQQPQPFADNCQFLAAGISADPQLLPALQALVPAAIARLQVDNAWRLRFWLAAIAAQDNAAAAEVLRAFVLADDVPSGRRRSLLETVVQVLDERPCGADLQRLRLELAPRLGR